MPPICTDVNSLDQMTDRWLIEALSVMSSNRTCGEQPRPG